MRAHQCLSPIASKGILEDYLRRVDGRTTILDVPDLSPTTGLAVARRREFDEGNRRHYSDECKSCRST